MYISWLRPWRFSFEDLFYRPHDHLAWLGQSEGEGSGQIDDAAGGAGDDDAHGDAHAADVHVAAAAELFQGFADAVGEDLVHAGGDQPGDGADGDGQHGELEEENTDVAPVEHGRTAFKIDGQGGAFQATRDDEAQGYDHQCALRRDANEDDVDVAEHDAEHG